MGMVAALSESHQKSKDSVAGTARLLAERSGIPAREIRSIRKNSKVHAEHDIVLRSADVEIGFSTTVRGLRPYALGGIELAFHILRTRKKIPDGINSIENLI